MKKIIHILLLALFISSCSKEVVNDFPLNPITKTLELEFELYRNAKDIISINSTTSVGTNRWTYSVDALLPSFKPISIVNIGQVSISVDSGRNGVISRSVPQIKQYFGKNTRLSLNFADNNIELRSTNEQFIPPPVEIVGDNIGGSIPRGLGLNWVAGNPNDDIFIAVAFSNTSSFNEDFASTPSVYRYKTVKDNGMAILTDSDFSGIPIGAMIEIYVIRGRVVVAGGLTNGQGGNAIVSSVSSALISGTLE